MGRFAENPEKRKGLQSIFIVLVVCLMSVVGIGVAMYFLERDTEHNSDPNQSLSAPVDRN